MTFLGDLNDGIARLAQFAELDVEAGELPAGVAGLSDESVRLAFDAVAELLRNAQKLEVTLAGVIARRSSRDAGHGGLAQSGGYRTPVQMVQALTGVPRSEAIRVVRVGQSLADTMGGLGASAAWPHAGEPTREPVGEESARTPWHDVLGGALLSGGITRAQHDAIRRGLGEPPAVEGRDDRDVVQVWRLAAQQLVDEAAGCTVEDLAAAARVARDLIDPAGAEARWQEHYARRSFRMRIDDDGRTHGHIVFDDLTAAWWRSVLDAALRPRRGGPRFVAEDELAAARELQNDPRSNDQLAYDLVVDLLRAGSLAEAADVFGARQAGVRLVTMVDASSGDAVARDGFGRLLAVACTEDGRIALPGSVLDRSLCETAAVRVVVDAGGNPLDIGRERRLFTAAQRIGLATRDGGCMWPGCDRPPSYCEAHHIDHWAADEGRTDIDRGILLCSYHHLHLHATGWRIRRGGKGAFVLEPPPGSDAESCELRSTSPLRWMFDPPPRSGWRRAA